MRSSHSLDAVSVQFDDANLVANAGLLLPATLAQHLGLEELSASMSAWATHRGGPTPASRR